MALDVVESRPASATERTVAPDSPARLFHARCREWAALPALRWKERGIWRSASWADYFASARAVGLALAAQGCRRGDTVAILSENRVEWAYAEFGALGMGLIVSAIDPAATAREVARVVADTGARVAFVENIEQGDKLRRALGADALTMVMFDSKRLRDDERRDTIPFADFLARGFVLAETQGAAFDRAIEEGQAEDGALIVYDEGRADPPTAVTISNRDLMKRIEAQSRTVRLPPQSRNLAFFSLAHLGARVMTLYLPLACAIVVHFPEQPETVLNDLAEVQPHLIYAPARFWEKLHARVEMSMRGALWVGQVLYRRACRSGGVAGWLVFPRLRASLGLSRLQFGFSAGALSDDLAGWLRMLGIDATAASDDFGGDDDLAPWVPIETMLRFNPLIADAVVLEMGRDALGCAVLLDRESALATAQAHQIVIAGIDDLAMAAPILGLIGAEIDRVNKRLAPPMRLMSFRLLADIAAGDERAMTPSLRINRRYFVRRYASLIEEMSKEVPQ
jgi:long-subunit acyl-CoA synthetase (AMP-forming)